MKQAHNIPPRSLRSNFFLKKKKISQQTSRIIQNFRARVRPRFSHLSVPRLSAAMRWLPRLLSHAAAAVKASAAARSTTRHVTGGSHGFASGGWEGSPAVPREWLRKLWREELRKLKEAARSYESVEAAGAATEAPSRSYQYDGRDLDPVKASGFWKL